MNGTKYLADTNAVIYLLKIDWRILVTLVVS